jgi:hypothetical protein
MFGLLQLISRRRGGFSNSSLGAVVVSPLSPYRERRHLCGPYAIPLQNSEELSISRLYIRRGFSGRVQKWAN